MVSVNDLKTGLTVKTSDGSIWQVIEFQHVKPGKGAAFVRTKMRNLRTGAMRFKRRRSVVASASNVRTSNGNACSTSIRWAIRTCSWTQSRMNSSN